MHKINVKFILYRLQLLLNGTKGFLHTIGFEIKS
jgi:hypothetical protein